MKTGDLAESVSYDCTGLTDTVASVTFSMRKPGATEAKVDSAAATFTATSGTAGRATYDWEAADVDEKGTFYGEFELTYDDGRVTTYPNEGYITIVFEEDLN
jgi:hypothetical protein